MNTCFTRRQIAATTAIVMAVCLPMVVRTHAARGGELQPIRVITNDDITVGQALPITVSLQGPAEVHIYSDPVGAVSYDGAINGTSGTVYAYTASTGTTGPVTIYAITDGETVVATQTEQTADGTPGTHD